MNNTSRPLEDFTPYATLDEWLGSKEFDVTLATMSKSAGSKKPGRTIERLTKKVKGRFKALRIVTWKKHEKLVYGVSHTRGKISDVLPLDQTNCPSCWTNGHAIFQTDLYLDTKKEHTEGNAATVGALGDDCYDALVEQGYPWMEALDVARIYASGLEQAGLPVGEAYVCMIPYKGGALRAVSLPINRIEHGEPKLGMLLKLHDLWSEKDIAEYRDDFHLDALAKAMTPEGYPGAEAYKELVLKNAKKLEP